MNIKLSELSLNNIHAWPTLIKKLTILFFCLFFIFISFFLDIQPLLSKLSKEKKETSALNAKLKDNISTDTIKKFQTKLNNLLQYLPDKTEIPGLLDHISKMAEKQGLDVKSFTPLSEKPLSFYSEIPVQLSVAGHYHALAQFISQLSNLNHLVTLHDFTLTPINPESETLIMNMLIKTYRHSEKKTKPYIPLSSIKKDNPVFYTAMHLRNPFEPDAIQTENIPPSEGNEKLSLNFQEIKVRAALQIIADFTGLNIVTTDTVNGSLTLRLNNVPWEEALDVILKARGLEKQFHGNILFVAPIEEIATREKQALQAKQQKLDLEPLTSSLIQINYGKASDIAGLLKEKGNTLLSSRGNVTVDTRTNNLWIQDIPEKIEEVRQFVEQLDVPVKQVLIEARIVNINKNYERNLGIKFGVSNSHHAISGSLEGSNKLASGMNPSAIPINERLNFNSATKLEGGGTPASIGLALMRLGNGFLLDLELSALESEGGGQVISSPRLLTANQQAASIQAGQDIPYQEKTSSGATSVSFKKAVLSLKVTPQITPDKRILLKLAVNQDKRGLKSQEVQGVPVIETRQIETQVLVNNGQTIVLGGIYEQSENNGTTRVPFFSDIPFLGNLFKNTQKIQQKTELLIFVTPKVVEDSLE